MRFIIGFALVLVLASCGGKEKALLGRWSLDNIDYTEHFKGAPDEIKDVIKAKMDEEFDRLKGKTFFTFSEKGKLVLEAPNYIGKIVKVNADYHFNELQDSLFFDMEIPESYKIISLDSDKMVLKTDEMPKRTLHLSKTK